MSDISPYIELIRVDDVICQRYGYPRLCLCGCLYCGWDKVINLVLTGKVILGELVQCMRQIPKIDEHCLAGL